MHDFPLAPGAARSGHGGSARIGQARRCAGFSLLELAVVVALLGVASVVLLDRLRYYQEMAEKTKVEYTISAMKSALRLRMATMLLAGKAHEYYRLAEDNPMDWLERKPDNYIGTLSRPDFQLVVPGSWYFDSALNLLVYKPRHAEHFRVGDGQAKRLELKTVLAPHFGNAQFKKDADVRTDGVRLVVLTQYAWIQ